MTFLLSPFGGRVKEKLNNIMSGISAPGGTGSDLTPEEELWILQNHTKNVIDSSPTGGERQVTEIVESAGNVVVTHND